MAVRKKTKSRTAGTAGTRKSKNENAKAKFSAATAKVASQEQRIIAALRRRPHTTVDFRSIGILQISARVWGLRRKGWEIKTARVTLIDRDGFPHPRAGLYSLDPSQGGAQ